MHARNVALQVHLRGKYLPAGGAAWNQLISRVLGPYVCAQRLGRGKDAGTVLTDKLVPGMADGVGLQLALIVVLLAAQLAGEMFGAPMDNFHVGLQVEPLPKSPCTTRLRAGQPRLAMNLLMHGKNSPYAKDLPASGAPEGAAIFLSLGRPTVGVTLSLRLSVRTHLDGAH